METAERTSLGFARRRLLVAWCGPQHLLGAAFASGLSTRACALPCREGKVEDRTGQASQCMDRVRLQADSVRGRGDGSG